MANNSVGLGSIFLHVFLTVITGGAWLIVLVIWFLLKAIQN